MCLDFFCPSKHFPSTLEPGYCLVFTSKLYSFISASLAALKDLQQYQYFTLSMCMQCVRLILSALWMLNILDNTVSMHPPSLRILLLIALCGVDVGCFKGKEPFVLAAGNCDTVDREIFMFLIFATRQCGKNFITLYI